MAALDCRVCFVQVVYTHPEVAWVGKNEEDLKEAVRAAADPFRVMLKPSS